MTERPPASLADLLAFLDASPSPFHAVASVAERLLAAGFSPVDERAPWEPGPGRRFVIRGGSLVAWAVDGPASLAEGFRIVGAHTDSPNLRVKPRPDTGRAGYRQLGVEVYGGALYNSWLDRDLGLSGRVVTADGDVHLVKVDRPLARVPQLAIHLDRGVNDGLKLNAQQHLVPLWGLGTPAEGDFADFLGKELSVAPAAIASWDMMLHDLSPAALLGRHDELVSSGRIDNLLSCWAGTRALAAAVDGTEAVGGGAGVPVLCLFDHEEIGSQSSTGAAGAILPTVLERITLAAGLDRQDHLRALAASFCLSADGAHGTHPNYPERHEPGHQIALDGGPVLKLNANVRYATDAPASAVVKRAAAGAGVPLQEFVVRTDMPCGSTIGPITAARLGIPTVDVGVAQLSMHSARELCGSADPLRFVDLIAAVLTGV
jgi:aspartyl aminopeptidase